MRYVTRPPAVTLPPVDATGYPAFQPRAPWWGADLQTLRNTLRGPVSAVGWLDEGAGEQLWLPLGDGTGDELSGQLHHPGGRPASVARAERPLVVLVHGLGGDETSVYLRVTAAHLLGLGHPVLRLSLRGAGPSRERCRFQYHAGRSADLRAALATLLAARPELAANGIALVGYSLGGNLVLKLAGEGAGELPLRAIVSVSAPIDLAEASRRFWYFSQ